MGSEKDTHDSFPVDELVGQVVGKYEILSRLAEGGMGRVYIAKHTVLGRRCVVKTIIPALASDQDIVSSFLREIQLGAMVDHPNIITFYDAGILGNQIYLAMEYFEGDSLSHHCWKTPQPPERVTKIGVQMASALAAAHERGIIHRDIKPQNVLINSAGEIRILDFGIAEATQHAEFSALRPSGKIYGSPSFMAPEQVDEHTTTTHAVDIYGLGGVLYFCLTGRPPYIGETPIEVVAQIGKPFPPPSRLQPVPPEFERIVMKCLRPHPDERYATVREVEEALEHQLRTASNNTTQKYQKPIDEAEQSAPALLRVFDPEQGCREYPLPRLVRTVIGRADDAMVRLKHGTVSRHHAAIYTAENDYYVEDLGSLSGVFVNGKRADASVLRHGDTVQISKFMLEFRLEDAPAEDTLILNGVQTTFSPLPSALRLRYRHVPSRASTLFNLGDTLRIEESIGGLQIPCEAGLPDGDCLEAEILWPDGSKRRVLGEVVGVEEGPRGNHMRIKLHRVEAMRYKEILEGVVCGDWVRPHKS